MFTLFKSGRTRNIREGLLLDKVLSLEAIEQAENLADNLVKEPTKLRSSLVFSFGQPFNFGMKQRSTHLNFVDLKAGKLQGVEVFTKMAGKVFFVSPIPIRGVFS
jgi:hypothetical protein